MSTEDQGIEGYLRGGSRGSRGMGGLEVRVQGLICREAGELVWWGQTVSHRHCQPFWGAATIIVSRFWPNPCFLFGRNHGTHPKYSP